MQTVFLEKIQIRGVKPDIALVFVFIQGWVDGKKSGFFWGLALGGLIDLFSTGILGPALILKSLVGFIAGVLGKSFLHLSLHGYVFFFLMVSLLHDVSGLFFLHEMSEELSSVLMEEAVIRLIYNLLFSVGAALIIWEKFNRKGTFEYGGTIFSPGRKSGTRE